MGPIQKRFFFKFHNKTLSQSEATRQMQQQAYHI